MEYSRIHILSKFGEDDYCLWTPALPREEIGRIRRQTPVVVDGIEALAGKLPVVSGENDEKMNFILPAGSKIQLFPVDMGSDFAEHNQHNGMSVRGTWEQTAAALREGLKMQGYALRANASFQNVDVLETLQKIMEHNTHYHQTDFACDRETLLKAAKDRNAPRHFFWMSRNGGTWCFPERDVYINHTSQHNTWFYYGGCQSEEVKAFWVELLGEKEGRVMGNVLGIDYQKHLDFLCTHSLSPEQVEVVFKNPNSCHILAYSEYNQNWTAIAGRYGTVERTKFLVGDENALTLTALQGRTLFQDHMEPMEVDEYVKQLDQDRLSDYGYTADDLLLTGPMDAQRALKQGMECFILNRDGSKELLSSQTALQQAIYNRKLFGMTAEEKELLRYFKQDAFLLFREEEMQKIYRLALQAGMEGSVEENGGLDNIIHKIECVLQGQGHRHMGERETVVENGEEMPNR